MWLAHFLPLRMIAAVGNAIGAILYWLIPERRRVTRINLEKCFPQMPRRSRERLARAHFRAFCRSFIERGILWWAPRSRIERMVRIEGLEHLQAVAGGPVILLTPHPYPERARLRRGREERHRRRARPQRAFQRLADQASGHP